MKCYQCGYQGEDVVTTQTESFKSVGYTTRCPICGAILGIMARPKTTKEKGL